MLRSLWFATLCILTSLVSACGAKNFYQDPDLPDREVAVVNVKNSLWQPPRITRIDSKHLWSGTTVRVSPGHHSIWVQSCTLRHFGCRGERNEHFSLLAESGHVYQIVLGDDGYAWIVDINTNELVVGKRHDDALGACDLPYSDAIQLDAPTQYYLGTNCPTVTGADPKADPLRWQWTCLAAHRRYPGAQRRMGVLIYYNRGETPQGYVLVQAYKWFKLAMINGGEELSVSYLSRKMAPDQIAEAERLVAEWKPSPAECELETRRYK